MKILFFDGYCTLCNWLIDTLIKKDKKNVLRFASLQGETAKQKLPSVYRESASMDTVVYLREDKIYIKSSAILWSLYDMSTLWSLAIVFVVLPTFLRDSIYNWIAKNRYRWFGKKETCRIPNASEKEKILN